MSKVTATTIENLAPFEGKEVQIQGWLANKRTGKGLAFLIMRDGSGLCQCVVDEAQTSTELLQEASALGLESSLRLTGTVVHDPKQVGGYEIRVTGMEVLQNVSDYPIAKKEHGVDFLMDHRHLWLRSRRQWAIMRVRNQIIQAIHAFFQERGFVQMDAPIFTGNACEGTSTLFETDFYGEPAYLSQSGQLYGESMAMAMGRIYTFGPTFRAEKSKTRRHLSEFWMIEPEMAFCDLDQNMDLIESFLQSVTARVLEKCPAELEILERDVTYLKNASGSFPRLTYEEAVEILKGRKKVKGQSTIEVLEADLAALEKEAEEIRVEVSQRQATVDNPNEKKGIKEFNKGKIAALKNQLTELEEKQKNIPAWLESARNFKEGNDFGGSDETVLTRLFDRPIMVYNWPHEVKAFYMKRDPKDERWARGVDVLAPEGYGEIVGGGERETNLDWLQAKIKEHKLPMEAFEWYLDLRRYGSVPHSGFGLGLERLVAWICGLPHVRETIPFPRMYGRLLP